MEQVRRASPVAQIVVPVANVEQQQRRVGEAAGVPIPIAMIDLVIVPGLGFDEFGNRLGRGRGFYDRFLAHPEFHGVACGLAFAAQLFGAIPVGPLDRQVDMLVTDAKVRRFQRSAAP